MTVQSEITSYEQELEEAVRGLCGLITKMQQRAARYLPDGDPDLFIGDMLELLDGPEQRFVQSRACALLNEQHVQTSLRR